MFYLLQTLRTSFDVVVVVVVVVVDVVVVDDDDDNDDDAGQLDKNKLKKCKA